jgi:hypothetical protein
MGGAFLHIPKIRCLFKVFLLNGVKICGSKFLLFKRYASKQNTQLEASKKGMFDKMGVEAVESLIQ